MANLGKKIATVHDARYDSCSRNVLRYDDLAECVSLGRIKDHFICKFKNNSGKLIHNNKIYNSSKLN